jgi:hypothetical protein
MSGPCMAIILGLRQGNLSRLVGGENEKELQMSGGGGSSQWYCRGNVFGAMEKHQQADKKKLTHQLTLQVRVSKKGSML